MKQVLRFVLLAFVFALSQNQATAQWYFGGGGYGGVGTAYSAEEHGMADIVRSEGMYNQMTSAAMINYEEARGKYIDNQKKWFEFYMQRKRVIESEKAKEREARMESRARYVEYRAANPDLAPRLSTAQLDTLTGQIKWPSALKRDCFALLCQEMEALLNAKALLGSTSENSQAIFKKTREIHAELRKHIGDIVTQDFVQARKFLESLATEGTVPRDY